MKLTGAIIVFGGLIALAIMFPWLWLIYAIFLGLSMLADYNH